MTALLRAFGLGFGFQARELAVSTNAYFSLVSAPFFTITLLSMVTYSGRGDLASYAVVAPTLMTLWLAALMYAGEMISEDREGGRLELLVASPVSFPALLFGRLCGAMLLALPAFGLSILAAGLVMDAWITIHHPVLFVLTALAVTVSTAATAAAFSALFVLAPSARIVQNTLPMPVFVLSGVMVPITLFPGWLEAVGRLLYLSWGADLMRDALAPEAVEHAALRLLMVLALGALGLLIGGATIVRFLRRARSEGTLSQV
ncbi:ABC transporter permease [Nocardiopsis sp. HNM0947]|uniref:ABC transporter permease n=1 Tax=Nocardiopsis coralli TaxID=2772213 RepID=A0ABR9P354_9ACTN|nr:ABC transporter permease [Nocardiopsis coralli]MBE2998261.1 ABC transporter permease [Nocardiopsis coralli]